MKDWFGILIFVAIAVANIILEQKRQQKKKSARGQAAPASSATPLPKRAPVVQRRTEVQSDRPVAKEPSLQEALQSLFEQSRMEPRKEAPPPLPRKPEVKPPRPPARVAPSAAKPVAPVTLPQTAQPIVPLPSEHTAVRWFSRSDFRARASLRRAVFMSEVLAKPKGLQ